MEADVQEDSETVIYIVYYEEKENNNAKVELTIIISDDVPGISPRCRWKREIAVDFLAR